MRLYCMCEAHNDKPDSQAFMAPNRYCSVVPALEKDVDTVPPLALRRTMKLVKIGVPQVILDHDDDLPNDWRGVDRPSRYRRHYPNVDFYECPVCKARIVRE